MVIYNSYDERLEIHENDIVDCFRTRKKLTAFCHGLNQCTHGDKEGLMIVDITGKCFIIQLGILHQEKGSLL